MRLMILSFCALLMAVPAQAQDDFYVDLSALDGLDGGFASDEAELLFPPVAAETKAKEAPKTVAKAAPKPQPKPVAAKKAAEAPQAKAEVKPDLPEPKAEPKTDAAEANAEAAPAEVEPQTMAVNKPEKVENPAAPAAEQTPAAEPAPVVKPEPLPMPALNNKPVVVEPLVAPAEEEEDPTGVFAFGEGLYDVTSVMKLQLDELLKKFENPVANKILIVAYNYDKDGGFMSKHIALKRSTGIRSYLLNKGYKNFSIKIINTDNPQQKNLTEVSEIK